MRIPKKGLVQAEIVYGTPKSVPAVSVSILNFFSIMAVTIYKYGNISVYTITQLAQSNQKDKLKLLISLNLNFSSSLKNLLLVLPS